jgi:23S rRNA (pseudouridine1915-N3)-methyltransferase
VKPLKIKLLCIGSIKESYLKEGIDDYIKRIKPFSKVEIIEKKEVRLNDNPAGSLITDALNQEADSLLKIIDSNDFVILLDLHGKEINNDDYVQIIEKAKVDGYSSFVFIIGSSYGVSHKLRQKANFCWSLSKLTFTHQMIRFIILEQIYRGFKISHNQPYHK